MSTVSLIPLIEEYLMITLGLLFFFFNTGRASFCKTLGYTYAFKLMTPLLSSFSILLSLRKAVKLVDVSRLAATAICFAVTCY